MKTKAILTAALIATAGVSAAAPAAAQSYRAGYVANWQPINARFQNLDRRIDVGVRNGALTRREAANLRGEFQAIARLEANYRRGGLTQWERADLDRRFDGLSARIRHERRDRQDRRGRS